MIQFALLCEKNIVVVIYATLVFILLDFPIQAECNANSMNILWEKKLDKNSTFYYQSTDFLLLNIQFNIQFGDCPIHGSRKLSWGHDSGFTLAEAEM